MTNQAYRGYLIRSTLTGQLFITKDGQHICYADTLEQAKLTIDTLVTEYVQVGDDQVTREEYDRDYVVSRKPLRKVT